MRTLLSFAVTSLLLASVGSAQAQEPAPPPASPPEQQLPGLPPPSGPAAAPEQPPPPPPPAPPPYAYPPGQAPPPGYYGYGQGQGQGYGPHGGYAYGPAGAYAPPPPAGPPPGRHLHDGFFLRMGLGVGVLNDKTTLDGSSLEVSSKGSGPSIDFAVGGALGDGFILAGSIVGIVVGEPTVEGAGYSGKVSNTSLSFSTLGLLGDWYIDPTGGFHVGALLGFASLSMQRNSARSSNDSEAELGSGLAAAAHVGYEGWVSDNWALGGTFRVLYAGLSDEDKGNTWHDKVFVPTLSFTATYN